MTLVERDWTLSAAAILLIMFTAQRYFLPPHNYALGQEVSASLALFIFFMSLPTLVRFKKFAQIQIVLGSVVIFVFLSILSSYPNSINLGLIDYITGPILGVAVFTISFGVTKANPSQRLILAISTIFIFPLIVAIWQFLTGSYFSLSHQFEINSIQAISSVFIHPNVFGLVSYIHAVLAVILLQNQPSTQIKTFATLILLSAIFSVIMANGRASILALFLFIYILALLRFRILRWISIAFLFPICAILFLMQLEMQLFGVDILETGKGLTSLRWRFLAWRTILDYWQLNNWLIGNGVGWIKQMLSLHQFGVEQIHNDYIGLAMQSGAIATIAYFAAYILLPISLLSNKNTTNCLAAQTLLAFCVSILLISLTENVFHDITSQVNLSLVMGVLTGRTLMKSPQHSARVKSKILLA